MLNIIVNLIEIIFKDLLMNCLYMITKVDYGRDNIYRFVLEIFSWNLMEIGFLRFLSVAISIYFYW
jgi:hypothetical protein